MLFKARKSGARLDEGEQPITGSLVNIYSTSNCRPHDHPFLASRQSLAVRRRLNSSVSELLGANEFKRPQDAARGGTRSQGKAMSMGVFVKVLWGSAALTRPLEIARMAVYAKLIQVGMTV